MAEPQDVFASRTFREMVFCSSAQSGKTQGLVLNTAAYSIKVDPMDTIIFCPTNTAARDFSMRRVDRMNQYSPEIGDMLLKRRDADNKFDKQYAGMMLTLSWPTKTELAGRPIGRVLITDRDRMPDDIEGEGEIFDLAAKRTTTFGSYAMCVAESSPSRPITDPKWIRKSKHEAPPCEGILKLYNRGDRRRWYWPCPECGSYFEGTFKNLKWKSLANVIDSSETVRMICPACSYEIEPDERFEMNLRGVWLKDGQTIDPDGTIHGEEPRSHMASFWLNGVAAAFITWQKIVQIYISADEEYERTGSEESLQKFYNNDLGEPYIPKSMESMRIPEHLQARAEDWGGTPLEPVIPPGVRFLIATIDVQKNMFIVQVQGIAPGMPFDMKVVDRFRLFKSNRLDDDGEREWVKPATYSEDWDLITEHVIKKTYPLNDGSGRRMMIKLTGCDSGGKEGVTGNAYAYYRRLRLQGLAGRFQLVKGDHRPGMPRTQLAHPDAGTNSPIKNAARGDIPVLLIQANNVKDELNNRLDSIVPGKGMVHFAGWLQDWFFAELCAEMRGEKGWENPTNSRNEAWDLLYYCIGLCISQILKIENLDWDRPPAWAADWDTNSLIALPDEAEKFANRPKPTYDFERFGRELA
jgi:phage terminase large subunit GpA-like protein